MNTDQWDEYEFFKRESEDFEESERSRHIHQLEVIEALRQKEEIKHETAMRQISNIRYIGSLGKLNNHPKGGQER
jgi:hypothetical protein